MGYEYTLISIAITLFLIMDPIGNIASSLFLLHDVPANKRKWVLIREMAIAYVVMLCFSILGEYIFDLLDISRPTILLASGVILFLVAIKILFPSSNSFRSNLPKGEPSIVPLAIPLIAGPSLLATVMLYSELEMSAWVMLGAITLAVVVSTFVLLLGSSLQRFLGNNGLLALEKLMGMVLILMAVQRCTEGVTVFKAIHGF